MPLLLLYGYATVGVGQAACLAPASMGEALCQPGGRTLSRVLAGPVRMGEGAAGILSCGATLLGSAHAGLASCPAPMPERETIPGRVACAG